MLYEIVTIGGLIVGPVVASRINPNFKLPLLKRKVKEGEIIRGVAAPTSIMAGMIAARILREPLEDCSFNAHGSPNTNPATVHDYTWKHGSISFFHDTWAAGVRIKNLCIGNTAIQLTQKEQQEIARACEKARVFCKARLAAKEEADRQNTALSAIEVIMGLDKGDVK